MDTTNSKTPPLDYQVLEDLEQSVGHEFKISFIQQFIEQVPLQLAALQQSVTTGDAESLRQKAHQLKGESLQIGANPLGQLCEMVEIIAQSGQLELAPTQLSQIESELKRVIVALTQVVNDG